MNADTQETVDRLEEIRIEIEELAREAVGMLDGITRERARSYWFAHIICALSKESEFLGSSMITMEETIEELREDGEGEEFDPDEEAEYEDYHGATDTEYSDRPGGRY